MNSNGGDLSTESLSFTQSSLFEPGQKNDINSAFGASFLFGQAQDKDNQEGQEKNTDLFDTDYSASKKVKLFSGNEIQLKPKKKSHRDIDTSELQNGGYLDMDVLFSKAKLRRSIKENNAKLEQLSEKRATKAKRADQVWTEKYRPHSYVQLCSAGNDRQYRTVLHWLKKWAPVVFGEERDDSNTEYVDALGRPKRKILLVHGPSGIGKTVAIHVLARQLGYNVEELNASNSMDTLPQGSNTPGSGNGSNVALKLKIMNALTSNKINSDGKPSCLVIDEIDSAFNSNEIIKVLNDLVYSDQRSLYKRNEDKKGKKPFVLNRPIICIANDIYSNNTNRFGGSPMDKLRQISEIVPLRKPMTKGSSGNALRSIKDHLMRINEIEKLGLDYQKIGEIVEICEGDIRASMNYLQFNGRKVNSTETSAKNSFKDAQMSWFSTVDMLFKRDGSLSKDENFEMLLDLFMNGNGRSAASNSSSFDKVIRGCFNQYLDVVRFQDDSLVKPSIFSDWLNYYDTLGNISDHDTSNYTSLVGLKVWSLFSEINRQKKESLIPNSKNLDFETFESIKQNKSTIKAVADKLPVQMKLGLGDNPEMYASYILPYFSKMFTPDLSSKVKSNLSVSEKSTVEKITGLVKEMDLRLETERDLEFGTIILQLSPNWDPIVYYDNQLAPVSLAGKQKQVQLRRNTLFPLITSELERLSLGKKTEKRAVEAEKEAEVQKQKRAKVSSSVDFFKGRYDGLASQINETKPTGESETTRIWVSYNEGFSNAVRKNIGWNNIWQI